MDTKILKTILTKPEQIRIKSWNNGTDLCVSELDCTTGNYQKKRVTIDT